ncbi:hypothetical protein [Lactobacillus gasseri]|uniref:hypothetical protein n=1 Tax=Lactobacillus gasseri TaxID=1596 RepID=UPI001192AF99|nr:hypothetical protein [Lactobacillus gasseri]TVU92740.1 hypothetical protein FOF75_05600 [Lactobacillus gasseri]TVV16477.1 hypothetical protein FOF66_03880 [Lactobacillus gasseri]
MKKKSDTGIIVAICILALLLGGATGFHFYNQHNDSAAVVAKQKKSGKKNDLNINKKKAVKKASSKKDDSKLLWMLMGYMAYARKNYEESQKVSSTSELVDAVVKDFKDGTLTATQKSSTNYTVSNDYGDVNVAVEPSDVKVTNDGTTVTSKSDLKQTFNKYTAKMAPVVKKISNTSSNNQSSNSAKSKKTSKDSKNKTAFSDEEMVVSAYIDNADGNTPQDKINTIKSILEKDNNSDSTNIPNDDYLSGLYTGNYKGKSYYSIASNLSTSHYEVIYLNGDSDQYATQAVAPGMALADESNKKSRSKKDLINKYKTYKQDLDEILNQLKDNKSRMSAIQDEISKRANDKSKSDDNDSDDSNSDNSNHDEDTNDSDEVPDY